MENPTLIENEKKKKNRNKNMNTTNLLIIFKVYIKNSVF